MNKLTFRKLKNLDQKMNKKNRKRKDKKRKKKKLAGFTLVEMLVVLLILSILILIMVPNLMEHRDFAERKSDEALVHVVESQMTMYKLEKNEEPTLEKLAESKFITKDQKDRYQKITAKTGSSSN